MRHTLYQNLKELRKRSQEQERADSDEDDGEQFAVQAGPVNDAANSYEPVADIASDDEDVLPLYGDSDSDYAQSSFEVGHCECSHHACTCETA